MPITRGGQDFVLPFSGASASQHLFNRASGTSLEPRVPRMLERLNIGNNGPQYGRGLLHGLSVSGHNLVLGDGFPVVGLDPNGITDRHNLIGVAAGPQTPVEIDLRWSSATPVYGYIGTGPIPVDLEPEALDFMERGQLWGQPNFAWGLGEITQPTANTVETVSFSKRIPRAMRLERIVPGLFRSDNAAVGLGQFLLTRFQIRGFDMLSRSGSLDLALMSQYNSDEDGLMIDEVIDTDDLVEIDVQVRALGAGVSGTVQLGFFTS